MNKDAIQQKINEINVSRNAVIVHQQQLRQELERMSQQEWLLTGALEVLQQIMVDMKEEGEEDAELSSELQLPKQNAKQR